MKLFGLKWVVLASLLVFSFYEAYTQSFKTAIEYIDYIDKQYKKLGEDMWQYTSAVAHGKNAKKVESKRKDLVSTMLTAKNNIAKMPAFQNDASLRDSMVSYLHLCYNILNSDYSDILNLEEIAEQSYDMMEAYMTAQEKANQKLDDAARMLNNQSKIFATKNNIQIVESNDKLSEKLEKANKAFKYYNNLYLIFFKSYKQEAYLLNAAQAGDVNAIEQNKDALEKFATTGIKSLETIAAYNGDLSLKTACKNLLAFYQAEAKDKAPVIIDFFMKQEKFNNAKKAIEAKQNSQSKEEVDAYNKVVAEYNKSGNSYNAVSEETYNKRIALINNWDNTIQAFFERHVSKN
jgi:hypothetical protein